MDRVDSLETARPYPGVHDERVIIEVVVASLPPAWSDVACVSVDVPKQFKVGEHYLSCKTPDPQRSRRSCHK